MKKTWEDAKVEELVIEATAGGGNDTTRHDGTWIDRDGLPYEGCPTHSAQ